MYRPYRGYKTKLHRRVLITACVVLLICLSGAFLYLFLQDYLVFSSDGVRLEFPFSRASPSPENTQTSDEVPNIVREDGKAPSNSSQTTPPSQSAAAPAVQLEKINAVYIPFEKLSDSAYLNSVPSMLEETGSNAVVVDIKDKNGYLSYQSDIDLAGVTAAKAKASEVFQDTIKKLSDQGIYVIGRICVFRDNIVSRENKPLSVKTASGATWLDSSYKGWLNPYSEDARQYILSIVEETSAMSFSEILLDDVTFPTSGKISLISYGSAGDQPRESAIKTLLEGAADTLSSRKIPMSVAVNAATVDSGMDLIAGQDISQIGSYASRICFYTTSSDMVQSAQISGGILEQYLPNGLSLGKIVAVFNTADGLRLGSIKQNMSYIAINSAGSYQK